MNAADELRAARYEQAFFTGPGNATLDEARRSILRNVLAVADAEQADLKAEVERLRATIDRVKAAADRLHRLSVEARQDSMAWYSPAAPAVSIARPMAAAAYYSDAYENAERNINDALKAPTEPAPGLDVHPGTATDVGSTPERLTVAMVDAFLAQTHLDQDAPYWGSWPHEDTLSHVEAYLLSLRDHLEGHPRREATP